MGSPPSLRVPDGRRGAGAGGVTDAAASASRREMEGSGWLRSALAGKQATHGIYIEIVVLAVILALESKRPSGRDIVSSVVGATVALVLAEFYAYYIGIMIGTGRRPTPAEIRATLLGTALALLAALPPILLLMLGVGGLIRLETGFLAAKWAGVAVIGLYAVIAHRRAGLPLRRSLPASTLLALVGVGLVLLKQYFH